MPGEPLRLRTDDGQTLAATVFEPSAAATETVVIACATGVLARYYRRYAEFLGQHGYRAITFDYRGVGESRTADLSTLRGPWSEWGRYDLDAALGYALDRGKASLVGHSFGGFAAGLAPHGAGLHRILMVGAQHAFWLDYRHGSRARFWYRWHLKMPLLTRRYGYFPGKRLGLTEDLPRGVALDWACSPRDFTRRDPELRRNLAAVEARIAAVAATDDPFATPRATERMLGYYPNAVKTSSFLPPARYRQTEIGHFSLFNDKFATTFWLETVDFLAGREPWP